MKVIKALWKRAKSRFYWLAGAVGVGLPALQEQMPMLKDFLGDNYSFVFVGLAVIIAILREDTTKAIRDK
jgi:hypothetical protein